MSVSHRAVSSLAICERLERSGRTVFFSLLFASLVGGLWRREVLDTLGLEYIFLLERLMLVDEQLQIYPVAPLSNRIMTCNRRLC